MGGGRAAPARRHRKGSAPDAIEAAAQPDVGGERAQPVMQQGGRDDSVDDDGEEDLDMGREEGVEEELDGAVRVGPRDEEVAQLAEHERARLPEDEELRARLRREEQLFDAKQLARAGGEEAVRAAEHDDEQPAEDLVPVQGGV